MKAYVFPGQGAQSPGMGSDLYAGQKALFDQANDILGFFLFQAEDGIRDF